MNALANKPDSSRSALRTGAVAILIAVGAWLLGVWLWIAQWTNPAEAVNNLSDWQYQVLCAIARIAAVLLIAALVVLWVLHQVQTAMPTPRVAP